MEVKNRNGIIQTVADFVKNSLEGAEGGHDWFHTERVWKLAKLINAREGGNREVVEIAALLHDIADPKFHNGDQTLALDISRNLLTDLELEQKIISEVLYIIQHISFKNKDAAPENPPVELMIVQDADRLDAIGAIGIARTFNFGGFKNNVMYDPQLPPDLHQRTKKYKKSKGTTINHFYEKLLLLKDLMNTETAKEIARRRHTFMLDFLNEFYAEWNIEAP